MELEEQGRIIPSLSDGSLYRPGQFFIHRRLGYRGVILYPWTAPTRKYHVGDLLACATSAREGPYEPEAFLRDPAPLLDLRRSVDFPLFPPDPVINLLDAPIEITPRRVPVTASSGNFYQVLCSMDDIQDATMRVCTTNWTFVAGMIEGLDYVAHEDIIPYVPSHLRFKHNAFAGLFQPLTSRPSSDPTMNLAPTPVHVKWMDASREVMSATEVTSLTSTVCGVTISVMPMVGIQVGKKMKEVEKRRNYWFYKVVVRNDGDEPIQLLQRTWLIVDGSGQVQGLTGRGVVGFCPKLTKEQRVFQYMSNVPLDTPSGLMGGFFSFRREDSSPVHVFVPTFHLRTLPQE